MSGSLRRHVSAILLFCVGCVFSAGFAVYLRQATDRLNATRFDSATLLASRFIGARLGRYVNALIHTKALFAVEKKISRDQFRRYVDDLDVYQKYPGTLGIGFAARGSSSGFGDQDTESFVVSYVEPPEAFNRGAIGHELGSGPIRRATIAMAARMGVPTASARIMVNSGVGVGTHSSNRRVPGFLILNPIYERGKPTETSDQRAHALSGFVFSEFVASTFFDDLFSQNPIDPAIDLNVYDGETLVPGALLFQRHPASASKPGQDGLERVRKIEMAGRTWSVEFRALPEFEGRGSQLAPYFYFMIGMLVSYLLAQLVWSMQDRIDLERRLVAQVRRAVASRDEFISIASHELKTPITSLKLQLAMALRQPTQSEQLIRVGNSQVDRLNRLIDELLDMTRIQAGRMKYDFESTDLAALVREIADRYKEPLQEAGCELRFTAPTPIVAEVDRFRFEQVVVNLLSNAMKYGRGGPVDIWVERDGPTAVIRVTDHGMGIPAEKQEMVFKRFERFSEDKSISGLGLGLYITKQIVEAHGGRIWVQSEVGHGSTFTVEIPARRERSPAPS